MLAKYADKFKHPPTLYNGPEELPYMKHVIRMLEFVGSWPYKELGLKRLMPKFYYRVFFYIYCVGLTTGTSYLLKHQNVLGFIELGHSYITVFMTTILVQRMSQSLFPSYNKTVINFMRNIHLFHYREKSEYAAKVYNEIYFILHYFLISMVLQGAFAGVAFAAMPAYFNYLYGMYGSERPPNMTFDNSVFYDLPFDYENELYGHLVLFIINFFLVVHSAFCFVALDVLLLVIIINLWGHVKILKQRLYDFPLPANNNISPDIPGFFNNEELKNVTTMLKDIVRYHKLICDYNNEAADTFGLMMCLYSLFHQVCLCILLLKCSQNNIAETLRYGLIFIYMLQQLVIISTIFEMLCSESETLKDAVYAVPWECMDTKNRKIVHILLFVSQTSMEFKAMGMVRIGVQTMSAILKTTISYFMLLKTLS